MTLTSLDWAIVAASIIISFLPALLFWRRAGSSTAEFFTSGRAAPWWLVGVSMVATTFSTDTPNLVTNLVREHGVAENWVWWSFLLTGMATVFFYARLWRRSGGTAPAGGPTAIDWSPAAPADGASHPDPRFIPYAALTHCSLPDTVGGARSSQDGRVRALARWLARREGAGAGLRSGDEPRERGGR